MDSGNKIRIHNKDFVLFLKQNEIQHKIKQLANSINSRFEGKELDIIIVLDGAEPFSRAILPQLNFKYTVHFQRLKTYKGLISGQLQKTEGLNLEGLNGEDILILEDIIDTGFTLDCLIKNLKERTEQDVFVASLLIKPDQLKYPITADFFGFDIGPEFVVGFGMDYNEMGRDLGNIYRLTD